MVLLRLFAEEGFLLDALREIVLLLAVPLLVGYRLILVLVLVRGEDACGLLLRLSLDLVLKRLVMVLEGGLNSICQGRRRQIVAHRRVRALRLAPVDAAALAFARTILLR